ncbi:hypothetical protein AN33_02634, partial [Mycobacterium tuberculosis M987]
FGSDDVIFSPGEVKEIDVEFPSPLGVLGLTTGVIRAGRRDCCRVSVPSRGFGSDDPSRPSASHRKGWRKFPSPLGVLGLIREIHCALFKVSVPSRGFGSDDRPVAARLPPPLLTWFPSPLGVLGLTTLKIRGQRIVVEMFPSPLGVLGLTTSDSISPGGQQISHVSVPSRGFGSDDLGQHLPGRAADIPCFRPLSGFWV